MADKSRLVTMTGECFQPVRLHYQLLDHQALLQVFNGLGCIDRDSSQGRWVWLYDQEAKSLTFKRSFSEVPKEMRPIVLGSFFLREREQLLLDLRSCERALAAIVFFDSHLPRRVARVEEAEVVNKLFAIEGNEHLTPTSVFDSQVSVHHDPEALVQRVRDLAVEVADPQKRLGLALELMQRQTKEPLPEFERFPIHYYVDGIEGVRTVLQMRQLVALQHWLGNTSYSMYDAIQGTANAITSA